MLRLQHTWSRVGPTNQCSEGFTPNLTLPSRESNLVPILLTIFSRPDPDYREISSYFINDTSRIRGSSTQWPDACTLRKLPGWEMRPCSSLRSKSPLRAFSTPCTPAMGLAHRVAAFLKPTSPR